MRHGRVERHSEHLPAFAPALTQGWNSRARRSLHPPCGVTAMVRELECPRISPTPQESVTAPVGSRRTASHPSRLRRTGDGEPRSTEAAQPGTPPVLEKQAHVSGSLSSSPSQGRRPKPRPVRNALMRFPVRVHRPVLASTRSMAAWDPRTARQRRTPLGVGAPALPRGRAVDAVYLGDRLGGHAKALHQRTRKPERVLGSHLATAHWCSPITVAAACGRQQGE